MLLHYHSVCKITIFMRLSVLILRVSTLLHRFISFCRLAFRQRRPGLFPDRRPCAYPPSYLGLGLMGILPSFLPRSFEQYTHSHSVHIPHSSVLSSGISSPMVERPFSGNIGIASALATSTMKAVVGIAVSSLARCIAIRTGFLFWQADYWHPSS